MRDVGAQQLPALLEHGGAERTALRDRQPLPHRLEQRVVLAEQATERRVQLVEPDPPRPVRPHIVPGLVREALDVVGQVAGELDDGRAEARLRPEAGLLEARLEEVGELIGGNPLEAHDRSGLVERPAAARASAPSARLGSGEDIADLR